MAKIADPDDLDPAGTAEIETVVVEFHHGKPAGVGYTPGSPTSGITAKIVAPTAANKRQLTWEFINDAGDYGGTHDETVAAGINAETGGARMSELKALGRIKQAYNPDGKKRTRLTRLDCPAGVCVSIPEKDWEDKRKNWPAPKKQRSDRTDKTRLRYAKKALSEIIDRREEGGLFADVEINDIAVRALAVLG